MRVASSPCAQVFGFRTTGPGAPASVWFSDCNLHAPLLSVSSWFLSCYQLAHFLFISKINSQREKDIIWLISSGQGWLSWTTSDNTSQPIHGGPGQGIRLCPITGQRRVQVMWSKHSKVWMSNSLGTLLSLGAMTRAVFLVRNGVFDSFHVQCVWYLLLSYK